ncbi:MAG: sugar transferase, partial [Planctomycetota bacterium]|nr:sugar transferase [Planctomycetota bacterium]
MPSTPEALATESWERLNLSETTYRSGGARLLDLALSITLFPAAVLLCLPLALVNAFVFRDPRKIFFQQRRTGRHGIAFTMFKFRTLSL